MQSAILEKTVGTPLSLRIRKLKDDQENYGNDDDLPQTKQSEYSEFIKRRSAPDVLVIGHQGEILFVSHTGSSVLSLLTRDLRNPEQCEAKLQLTQVLSRLQKTVLSQQQSTADAEGLAAPNALFAFRGQAVSLRGLALKGTLGSPCFVMILIEKVTQSVRSTKMSQPSPDFTPREQAVLRYVKKGFKNKEIACVLNIGVHTVKDHVKRIMKKVNVHTRTGILGKLGENQVAFG